MLNHLLELRRRAIYVLVFFVVFFGGFFFFANHLFQILVAPLLQALGSHDSLIATQITSPVLTPLKLAVNAAVLCTSPFILLQLWQFVAPALYHHERYNLRFFLFISLTLFLLGLLFCYFVVLPFMFQFFANAVPSGVRLLPDIAYALDFITRMLMVFGFCFQIPLLCLILVRLGWADLVLLKQIRPYVIVAAFTMGMLLTPPDVLSQIMLAVPLCLLYELGLLLAAFAQTSKLKKMVATKE
ncbi:twin-arginine translocase subunit TatC [Legionella jamestowniensis]|uniref:Sec-independent protein translocase protein TatC n=1 Tax=Legionella jamestowniensis TaxID=455 RepID=A0A0W0UIH0_9GAMM|nr:twin-arginine translocase subunit TatC [Legionella jamestowniensis]KTD07656.1 Sec-independent protein translocase TatC [Legionella jamestowniensis]OCH99399.1 twin arginine-targeting protein translocase TatC [Legionella jamestowniensis]SFL60181.1 sec-independent protein translocase protein TatC [Legionella jamestowniensis DSM 19215]